MGDMAEWTNEQQFYTDEVRAEYVSTWDAEEEPGYGLPIWTTNEGERIPLWQMRTAHLFNAMKMMFNHLAEAHGGQPVWFQKKYGGAAAIARGLPGVAAWWVVVMLWELDRRTDIPGKYLQPLQEIREQVFGGPRRLVSMQVREEVRSDNSNTQDGSQPRAS